MGWLSKAWKKVKKAVKKVVNTVKKVVKALKDIAFKVVGLIDFVASLIGIRPTKYLRLKITILTEHGKPVVDLKKVQSWFDMTKQIFKEKCNIEVRSPNLSLPVINLAPSDPPDYAYDCECSFGATFSDDYDYYSSLTNYPVTSSTSYLLDLIGYGEPFYAIVIKDITTNAVGCSAPLIANFAVLPFDAGSTTLAHEFGHVAWLKDKKDSSKNLMNVDRNDKDKDCELSNWQISKIRNSRYIVYSPRSG